MPPTTFVDAEMGSADLRIAFTKIQSEIVRTRVALARMEKIRDDLGNLIESGNRPSEIEQTIRLRPSSNSKTWAGQIDEFMSSEPKTVSQLVALLRASGARFRTKSRADVTVRNTLSAKARDFGWSRVSGTSPQTWIRSASSEPVMIATTGPNPKEPTK